MTAAKFHPAPSAESLAWQDAAACRGHEDPDLWFSDDEADREKAKDICDNECPVRMECLVYSLRFRLSDGVWGGKDREGLKHERKRLRKAA